MDALIVLCRFCEWHGPRVLMVTQADRSSVDLSGEQRVLSTPLLPNTPAPPTGLFENSYSPPGTGGNFQNQSGSVGGSGGSGTTAQGTSGNKPCPGCMGVPPTEAGMFSRTKTGINYVTTPRPLQAHLYASLRQACLRAFYCEVCPGQEGPIYFGDEHNGHVLSYLFQLADSKARGLTSRFCILVVSRDKLALLNSWPFLVLNLRRMVERLQALANAVSIQEQSSQSTRSIRLQRYAGGGLGGVGGLVSGGELHMAVRQNLRTQPERDDVEPPRSLAELTSVGNQDQDVYYKVHAWFTWLLRALSRRWEEYVLEGGPLDDQLVAQKRQKERAETLPPTSPSGAANSMGSGLHDENGCLLQDLQEFFYRPGVCELRCVYNKLGEEKFHQVALHICVGNQIVIFCPQSVQLAVVVAGALSRLLPLGCVQEVLNSEECVNSYHGNVVVMSSFAHLNEQVVTSVESEARVLVRIKCGAAAAAGHGVRYSPDVEPLPLTEDTNLTKWLEDLLSKSTVEVKCSPACETFLTQCVTATPPNSTSSSLFRSVTSTSGSSSSRSTLAYLVQVHRILNSAVQTESTLASALLVFREEWLGKARLLYTFTRTGPPATTPADKSYLALMKTVQCAPGSSDEKMIRFWQKGLSDEYKQQMYLLKRPLAT